MLPTDAAMEHGSNCNAIQNALQKAGVHIGFDQAAIVLIELRRELPELFKMRRKEKKVSGKTALNRQIMPCTCWPENTSDGRTILHKTDVLCPVHGCTA
jgi:hypothetical protein